MPVTSAVAPCGSPSYTALTAVTVVVDAARVTDTVKLPVAVLPDRSVAVHETVVEPTGNVAPDAGAQTTATPPPSTMSPAVAE